MEYSTFSLNFCREWLFTKYEGVFFLTVGIIMVYQVYQHFLSVVQRVGSCWHHGSSTSSECLKVNYLFERLHAGLAWVSRAFHSKSWRRERRTSTRRDHGC